MKTMFLRKKSGQMLVLFALTVSVLLFFTAMAVDFGMIYLGKAKLSRAVDSLGLRLAGNLPLDPTNRAEIAMNIIRANYPNFLEGVTYDEGSGQFTPAGAVSFVDLGDNTDRILITNNGQGLQIDSQSAVMTNVNPPLKIVTVDAQASTVQPTYFLKLAGIDEVSFQESAEAERVPSIIVLILDVSGSMRGNNGWQYLSSAVTNFVKNFEESQDQDFLAVVTFSSYATMMWPTNYMGNSSSSYMAAMTNNMVPSNNFVDPVIAFMTNTPATGGTNALISQGVRYSGVTCAQEGMRLGYQVMNNLLGGITDQSLRNKLRTYYIMFTDGEFNTTRTYVRGTGFGLKTNASGTLTNFYHNTNNLPFFHFDLPLNCNANDFSSYSNVIVYNNDSMTSSNVYNLNDADRFGRYSGGVNTTWTNFLDAISCTLAGYQVHGNHWHHKIDGNNYHSPASIPIYESETWGRIDDCRNAGKGMRKESYWRNDWTTSYRFTNCMNHGLWTGSVSGDDGSGWTSWNNKFFVRPPNTNYSGSHSTNTSVCYSTSNGRTNMYWMALYSAFKNHMDPAMFVPAPVLFNNHNPTKQSWYPTNAADYNMDTRTISAYPGGRTFANTYGFWFQRAGTSNRNPCTLPDATTDGRCFGSVRLSDFYPDFTYGAHPTNIFNFTNTAKYPADMVELSTNSTNGVVYEMYSFKDKQWKDFDYDTSPYYLPSIGWEWSNTAQITAEGNWLTMMQAWIARKEQNAQVYLVNFSNNSSVREKRQIANDRTGNNGMGITPWFGDQPTGGFYNTTDQSTLNSAFDDIARKISARLTR